MNWYSLLITFALTASAAGNDDAKTETKNLEGTWQLVSAVSDGQKTRDDIAKKIRVVIKDGKRTVLFEDKEIAKDVPFTFDATKNPKEVTDMLPDGKTIKGIYKIEGDMLTNCVAKPDKERPAEFVSKHGSGHTLRVLKRVKP